jgi:hypothetical protein
MMGLELKVWPYNFGWWSFDSGGKYRASAFVCGAN